MKNLGIIGGWTAKQRNHLRRLQRQGSTIAYWCSDARGRPANHTCNVGWCAKAGLVQVVDGPLEACSGRALHATLEPHRWAGARVWVVGLVGSVKASGGKLAALRREIIGEVLPEFAWCASVGVRIGRKDLSRAKLYMANLSGADLSGADLYGADLYTANLSGANLSGANLYRADLYMATLSGANLSGADLYGADRTENPPPGWKIQNGILVRE